jgi:Ti-type conjugative transfer relaxase TraA
MLSIGQLGTGQATYYTNTVARGQEDYYTGQGEAKGTWLGTGSQRLGLQGQVDPDDFSTIIKGRKPNGDKLRPPHSKTTVPGFDLTFSAPKSVSVLYGIGDDVVSTATRLAHDEAVRQAIGYLERHAGRVRRGRNGKNILRSEGLVIGAFRHRSSRSGDPQLHTHAVVANAGLADGKWSALDSRALYAHARTAGFLYQAAMRHEMTRSLGVEWEPVRNGVSDISGVDPEVLHQFSQRKHELEEHLNQIGRRGARARELAALKTRKHKDYGVSPDQLRANWKARAEEHGFGRAELEAVLNRPARDQLDDRAIVRAADRMAGAGGVTRNLSTFDRRDVLRDWAQEHRAGAPVDRIEKLADAWLASETVVPIPSDGNIRDAGGRRYTTVAMLEVERELVDNAMRRRGAGVAVAGDEEVRRAVAERPSLTTEQADVIRGLTRSGDGVQVVRAAAGTGKTFALDAAREAWQADDIAVLGCALSARAAVELQSQSGIRSDTVAHLQRQLARGNRLPAGSVLIVDEAGMVGSRQLAELATAAERTNAKLVLVGDDRQLPEIDAGGGLRGIASRIGALELRQVLRQQNDWDRAALDDLRHGRVEEWAQAYLDHGRIASHPTAETARRALVEDWWIAAREPGTEAAMVAHRRADVADLNQRARRLMAADGRLGEQEVAFHGRTFAAGDRVIARRNDRQIDIVNGARGTVVDVDTMLRSVMVEVQGGDVVRLDASYLDAGHLDHGYALTAHAAQGATVDKAFILGSDDLYREWGYTALSRHRDEARYYAVSEGSVDVPLPGMEPQPDPLIEDIVDALEPSRRKELALDAAGGQPLAPRDGERGVFAELRSLERESKRATDEAQRLAARALDAELRLGELVAELDATPRRRVGARGEIRAAIERQQQVVERWRERAEGVDQRLTELGVQRALIKEPLGPEPEVDIAATPADRALTPALDLDDGLDFGP